MRDEGTGRLEPAVPCCSGGAGGPSPQVPSQCLDPDVGAVDSLPEAEEEMEAMEETVEAVKSVKPVQLLEAMDESVKPVQARREGSDSQSSKANEAMAAAPGVSEEAGESELAGEREGDGPMAPVLNKLPCPAAAVDMVPETPEDCQPPSRQVASTTVKAGTLVSCTASGGMDERPAVPGAVSQADPGLLSPPASIPSKEQSDNNMDSPMTLNVVGQSVMSAVPGPPSLMGGTDVAVISGVGEASKGQSGVVAQPCKATPTVSGISEHLSAVQMGPPALMGDKIIPAAAPTGRSQMVPDLSLNSEGEICISDESLNLVLAKQRAAGAPQPPHPAQPPPSGSGTHSARPSYSAMAGGRPKTAPPPSYSRRNVVQLKWSRDGRPPTRGRVVELILGMGFKASDIYALINPVGSPEYDISFVRMECLDLFWERYDKTWRGSQDWDGFTPVSISRQSLTKKVTILVRNESIPAEDLAVWLSRYGNLMGPLSKVLDEVGIWTGAWTVSFKLKVVNNVIQHIPSLAFLGRDRLVVFYPGQPKLCNKCGEKGHFSASCIKMRCSMCQGLGHLAKDCSNIRCNLCFQLGHSYGKCPEALHNMGPEVLEDMERMEEEEGQLGPLLVCPDPNVPVAPVSVSPVVPTPVCTKNVEHGGGSVSTSGLPPRGAPNELLGAPQKGGSAPRRASPRSTTVNQSPSVSVPNVSSKRKGSAKPDPLTLSPPDSQARAEAEEGSSTGLREAALVRGEGWEVKVSKRMKGGKSSRRGSSEVLLGPEPLPLNNPYDALSESEVTDLAEDGPPPDRGGPPQ